MNHLALLFQPMGVFAILEEECIVPKATDMTFLQKMHNNHEGKHPKYAKPRITGKSAVNYHFEIAHYAGTVGYNVDGWLDKNKDPINEAVAGLFAKSSDPFVANLFKDYATECEYEWYDADMLLQLCGFITAHFGGTNFGGLCFGMKKVKIKFDLNVLCVHFIKVCS